MVATFAEDTLPPDVARALLARGGLRAGAWGWVSRRGSGRAVNEDAHGVRDGRAFVVADGMGGRPGGAVAAHAAVGALLDSLAGHGALDWSRVTAAANVAVRAAGSAVGHERVGVAVAGLRVAGGRATVMHLGDVRAYRLGTDGAVQLTTDHNVAEELLRVDVHPGALRLNAAELAALTVFLGDVDSAVRFDVRSVTVAAGDRLVLCTDGIHGRLGADVWADVSKLAEPQRIAEHLADAAVAAGSTDDATALVVAFENGGAG